MKKWYEIRYTVYEEYPECAFEGGRLPSHTTWHIVEDYTESIRKANKLLKEHPDGTMRIIYR